MVLTPVLNALKAGYLRTATVYYNETVHNEFNALSSIALPSNFVHLPSRLHRREFISDLYMIFEASFSMFSKDSVWKPGIPSPILLTNNMHLYHKFLDTEPKQDIIETIINAYGMEHLIEVITLDKVDSDGNVT